MSLSSLKAEKVNALKEDIISLLSEVSTDDKTQSEQMIEDYADKLSNSIFNRIHEWIDESKKTVEIQVISGSSSGQWQETNNTKSGLDF